MAAQTAAYQLTLTWKPIPDPVIGYNVYYGETHERSEMQLLQLPQDMNLAAPSVEFDILSELNATPGENVCFRVEAYDNVSTSTSSSAVCTTI